MKRIKVFVNDNLDGAVSLYFFKKLLRGKFQLDVTECSNFNFESIYRQHKNLSDYAKVYSLNITTKLASELTSPICKGIGDASTANLLISQHPTLISNKSEKKLLKRLDGFYNIRGISDSGWKLHAHYLKSQSAISFCTQIEENIGYLIEDTIPIYTEYRKKISEIYQSMSIYSDKKSKDAYILMVDDIQCHLMIYDIFFKIFNPKLTFIIHIDTKQSIIRSEIPDSENMVQRICGGLIDGISHGQIGGGYITTKFLEFSRGFNHVTNNYR